MPELSRRSLLLGAASAAALAAGCDDGPAPATDAATDLGPEDVPAVDTGVDAGPMVEPDPRPYSAFLHGVASGDPLPDAVILWTRVSPRPGVDPPASIDVAWEVASDAAFTMRVAQGTFTTRADRDWTVKVDATGLMAGRTYFYRFRALDFTSPVGRTRTAPTGSVARLRFGVVSCASLAHGYFHAYRALARRLDLDAIIHLGDYIYEYATGRYGLIRGYEPAHEIVRLDDYRKRYAQYHRDANLRAVHQQFPMIAIWDDHEFADNAYADGAENHMPMTEGPWADRKRAAMQAYREWMPIREQPDGRIFRRLRYGDLADLVMLDTRIWARPRQIEVADAGLDDPARTLLGAEQERWLTEQVTTSTARWKVLAQQVMVGQLYVFLNFDQWDGHPAARNRVFNLLRSMMVPNVVVLTGDIHSSWAMDLTDDPRNPMSYDRATGRGSIAVEFVVPAVTSPGFPPQLERTTPDIVAAAPHLKFADIVRRGYVILDVTPARVQAAYYHYEDITRPEPATERFTAALSTLHTENRLRRDMEAAPAPMDAPPGAPPEAQ